MTRKDQPVVDGSWLNRIIVAWYTLWGNLGRRIAAWADDKLDKRPLVDRIKETW